MRDIDPHGRDHRHRQAEANPLARIWIPHLHRARVLVTMGDARPPLLALRSARRVSSRPLAPAAF